MKLSRRKFIEKSAGASAALAFPTILPRHVLGGPNHVPPSEKILLGMIGVGGQGRHNSRQFLELPDVQIVAVADPAAYWDVRMFYYKAEVGRGPVKALIEEAQEKKFPGAKVAEFEDFRVMLEAMPEIDGVCCSTPDHTHAFVTANALRAGKHVYCEKPLTHNIWEGREIARLTRETGLATQMGNYGHSTEGIRQTVEFLRAGVIGKVKEFHSWGFAARWNMDMLQFPQESHPLPEGLNWDLWLGPARTRPFNHAFAPVKWRDFWEYGTGALGDFGCHDMDAAVWALDLKAPSSVQVYPGGFRNDGFQPDIIPYSEVGYYDFEAQGEQQAVRMFWYSGSQRPGHHPWLPDNFDLSDRGLLFVGEKGLIQCEGSGGQPRVFPEELRVNMTRPEKTLARSNGHFRDWADAIKGGPKPHGEFGYSARLSEIVLLGVVSLRLKGKRLRWDYENMKVTGVPEADELIREPARGGWSIG